MTVEARASGPNPSPKDTLRAEPLHELGHHKEAYRPLVDYLNARTVARIRPGEVHIPELPIHDVVTNVRAVVFEKNSGRLLVAPDEKITADQLRVQLRHEGVINGAGEYSIIAGESCTLRYINGGSKAPETLVLYFRDGHNPLTEAEGHKLEDTHDAFVLAATEFHQEDRQEHHIPPHEPITANTA